MTEQQQINADRLSAAADKAWIRYRDAVAATGANSARDNDVLAYYARVSG